MLLLVRICGMSKTETVESLLTPSLRVSRPVAACSRCRSAKIKCDGKLPACSACERSGKVDSCTSANDEFARGKERSYVAALEGAAQRLERKIAAAKGQAGTSFTVAPTDNKSKRRPVEKRRVSGLQRKEALDVNELVSDFGFLTVNATSRDFAGFSSTMSFAKLLMSLAIKTELSQGQAARLPPRYMIVESIEHYLQKTFVLLPFFSETDFMGMVSRVYQDSSNAMAVTPLDYWYIRLILAISHASLSRTQGDQHEQEALQHVSAAMELADYVIHTGSMPAIQALLLLVEYSLYDPVHFDSWYLVGTAARLVVDLGLHCDPPGETKINREELNMRRRIFHSTYALDRLISTSIELPFSFTDDSASGVPLPDLGPESQQPTTSNLFLRSIKPSLYLFDIRRVQSAFYQTTRSSSRGQWSTTYATKYASSISNDIHSWYSSIPISLPQDQMIFFNLERLYTQILVVAPHQKMAVVNMTELNKALVFEYCAQFIDGLHPVISNVGYHPFFTYAEVCRTRWVGRQFLEIMWSEFDRLLKTQHIVVGSGSLGSSAQDNCNRAITCVRQVTEILDYAGRRWQITEMKEKFEKESAVLVARLKNRQQEFGVQDGQQPRHQHQSQLYGYAHPPSQPYMEGNVLPPMQPYHQPAIFDTTAQNQQASPPEGYAMPSGSRPRRTYQFTGSEG